VKRRVVLVDDHDLFLAGVRAELGDAVDVVGQAGSVAEAVPLIKQLDPEVVLLDVHLPDGSGDAIINAVAPERPAVRFLALSVSDAAEDVIAVIRAGARGYVTKTISGEELAAAIERVAEGDAVFSPRLAGFVLDAFRAGDARRRRRRARRAHPARARGVAVDRAGLHVQGDRGPPAPVGEDRREPRLETSCASCSFRRGTSSRAGRREHRSFDRNQRPLKPDTRPSSSAGPCQSRGA
jgi:DNA-binding NarL/FixJ family response regulator